MGVVWSLWGCPQALGTCPLQVTGTIRSGSAGAEGQGVSTSADEVVCPGGELSVSPHSKRSVRKCSVPEHLCLQNSPSCPVGYFIVPNSSRNTRQAVASFLRNGAMRPGPAPLATRAVGKSLFPFRRCRLTLVPGSPRPPRSRLCLVKFQPHQWTLCGDRAALPPWGEVSVRRAVVLAAPHA